MIEFKSYKYCSPPDIICSLNKEFTLCGKVCLQADGNIPENDLYDFRIWLSFGDSSSTDGESIIDIWWKFGSKKITHELYEKVLKTNLIKDIINVILSEDKKDPKLEQCMNLIHSDKELFAKKYFYNHKVDFYRNSISNRDSILIFIKENKEYTLFSYNKNDSYINGELTILFCNDSKDKDFELTVSIHPNYFYRKGLLRKIFKLYRFIDKET